MECTRQNLASIKTPFILGFVQERPAYSSTATAVAWKQSITRKILLLKDGNHCSPAQLSIFCDILDMAFIWAPFFFCIQFKGAMFSFMASMEALCVFSSAVLFNGIYPLTLTSFPGMVFIVMAGFSFITLIFIQWVISVVSCSRSQDVVLSVLREVLLFTSQRKRKVMLVTHWGHQGSKAVQSEYVLWHWIYQMFNVFTFLWKAWNECEAVMALKKVLILWSFLILETCYIFLMLA